MQSGFSPAPCSPLRRLRAYSAELVRAPPYIKVERENCPPDAIRRYSHRCIGRARHKLKRARQLRRIYRSFCIRIVHARRAAFIHARRYAVLSRHSLFHTPNIGAGAAVTPYLSRFCIRIVHARRAAFIHARRYTVLSRHSLFRIPNSAFRISNSAFPLPFSTKKDGASPSRLFLALNYS